MQFIDLAAQYRHLESNIQQRINTVLNHGQYILGPEVSELEERLGEYVGVRHSITCGNGTDALQLCLMALGIGPGDAVFCPTFTFFASAEVIGLAGATPVFVDIDPATYNLCPSSLEHAIEQVETNGDLKPKAIIAVDLFGLPADYPAIEGLAKKHQLTVIEDAAQGFGGQIGERRAGSFGHVATTSFFPAKPLGCYGDGGAVFTNDDELAAHLRSLRVHGKGSDKYDNVRIGLNSRLDTLQAAILLEKLAALPQELQRRNEVASAYHEAFAELFEIPLVPNGMQSSWAQYTLRSTARDQFMLKLKDKGIPSVVYYAKCMHQQTVFAENDTLTSLSNAEAAAQQVFSLPMHPYLQPADVENVCAALLSA